VLSAANAAENPTALCARREMQSWQLLQLEPSALRQPDEFATPARLTANGRHLAATLHRLAARNDASQVYAQIANRLSELIGGLRGVRVDRDEKRELLTVMATMADKTEYPARALSDGTLRFLALAVLELDAEAPGMLCLEEPENGIHPDRIPAMLQLLQDIATDPKEPADESNPLRQVIVNTHSPSAVMAAPDQSVLLAKTTPRQNDRGEFECLAFACLPGAWRAKSPSNCEVISKGDLLAYLNPAGRLMQEIALVLGRESGSSASPRRRHRVIDHPEFNLLLPAKP
jgi:predicted ATPase